MFEIEGQVDTVFEALVSTVIMLFALSIPVGLIFNAFYQVDKHKFKESEPFLKKFFGKAEMKDEYRYY
ncbi:MAG: hypothetical protein HRT47_04170 [Candidatus Caenarcaniphilales bacterium]|nr:hypothetical protein [Candidatus Caenarcaniphilales bacterium]